MRKVKEVRQKQTTKYLSVKDKQEKEPKIKPKTMHEEYILVYCENGKNVFFEGGGGFGIWTNVVYTVDLSSCRVRFQWHLKLNYITSIPMSLLNILAFFPSPPHTNYSTTTVSPGIEKTAFFIVFP
jgi:hypothetical protein